MKTKRFLVDIRAVLSVKLSSKKWNTAFRLSTVWCKSNNGKILDRCFQQSLAGTFKIWRARQASPDSTLRSTLLQRHSLGTDHSSTYHRIFNAIVKWSIFVTLLPRNNSTWTTASFLHACLLLHPGLEENFSDAFRRFLYPKFLL